MLLYLECGSEQILKFKIHIPVGRVEAWKCQGQRIRKDLQKYIFFSIFTCVIVLDDCRQTLYPLVANLTCCGEL